MPGPGGGSAGGEVDTAIYSAPSTLAFFGRGRIDWSPAADAVRKKRQEDLNRESCDCFLPRCGVHYSHRCWRSGRRTRRTGGLRTTPQTDQACRPDVPSGRARQAHSGHRHAADHRRNGRPRLRRQGLAIDPPTRRRCRGGREAVGVRPDGYERSGGGQRPGALQPLCLSATGVGPRREREAGGWCRRTSAGRWFREASPDTRFRGAWPGRPPRFDDHRARRLHPFQVSDRHRFVRAPN